VESKLSEVLATHVAFGVEGEGLLGVGPYVAVAGEVGPKLRRLPYEKDGTISGGVEVSPGHWNGLAGDAGGLEEIVDDGLDVHVGDDGETEVGEEVHMR
jgi:hypothetical protein